MLAGEWPIWSLRNRVPKQEMLVFPEISRKEGTLTNDRRHDLRGM